MYCAKIIILCSYNIIGGYDLTSKFYVNQSKNYQVATFNGAGPDLDVCSATIMT